MKRNYRDENLRKSPPDKGFTLRVHPEGDTGGFKQGPLNVFVFHSNPRILDPFNPLIQKCTFLKNHPPQVQQAQQVQHAQPKSQKPCASANIFQMSDDYSF